MVGRNLLSLFAVALAALGIASCGGDEDSTTTTGPTDAPAQKRSADTASPPMSDGDSGEPRSKASGGSGEAASGDFTPKPHDDSGGGSEQFQVKGGDNSVQEFGTEAGGSEFDQAAAALHNFFDARAERKWAAACEYLGSGIAKSLEEPPSQATQGEAVSCATGLEALTNPAAAKELRSEAAQVDVGSVRLEGESGFILYRVGETVYAIPIAIEDGSFKVTALAGLPLT